MDLLKKAGVETIGMVVKKEKKKGGKMKVKDAVGVSIILHGILILSAIFSLNFSSGQVELKCCRW